ncbi:hypothetical protein ACHQM5_007931 [Ranunculus cassubicifolius]
MIRTQVLHRSHHPLIIQEEDSSQFVEHKATEQECLSLLKRCSCMEEFKQAHTQIIKQGHISIASNLISACALSEWGSMDYACSIFRKQDDLDDPFIFNAMVRGHVNQGNPLAAILLYREMLEREVQPDKFTYPPLLKAAAHLLALAEGMQIHAQVLKYGFGADMFVQNSLLNMYGKCGEMEFCFQVFNKMDQKSIASWSALISSHARFGLWYECLALLGEMTSGGWRPEESTLVSVLSSCSHLGVVDFGRCIHGSLLRNISGLNVIVQTSLVDMYVKCGCLDRGLSIFRNMPRKNQLSYSVMITGLAVHGQAEEALRVFSDMLNQGMQPDETVYVGVLTACSQAGLVKEGRAYFQRMILEHKVKPTVQHYGCMVDLLGRVGMVNEAYELIKSMSIEPNDGVWRCLLSACRYHQNPDIVEIARRNLFRINQHNAGDYLLLSNIYAQTRQWENAAKIRTEMVDRELNQTPGFCLVKVKQKVHMFVSQDKSHPECKAIYEMIHQMEWQLRFDGYSADTSQVLFDVNEEEKTRQLQGHSQKLAIAFALIGTHQSSTIRLVRNLRMCSDCHTYTRLISKIIGRMIIVRDQNRFHQFKDGTCSCSN